MLYAKEFIKEGISTKEIDDKIRLYIKKHGAKPTFLGYGGFPGSACISINDEVIHGIPSYNKNLKNGDIVKIDNIVYGREKAKSKKEAEQMAAKEALKKEVK